MASCQGLPTEFRDDVVRVARNREPEVTIEQIAKDFGVHPMTLQKGLQRAAVDDGAKPGQSRTDSVLQWPQHRTLIWRRRRMLVSDLPTIRRGVRASTASRGPRACNMCGGYTSNATGTNSK